MKQWKQVISMILAFVLIATGIYFVAPEAEEAKASETTEIASEEGDYITLAKTSVTWSGKSGEAPVATGDYADWLFAGWFNSEKCTLETAITAASDVNDASFAKFVPKDTLNVKFQTANGTVTDVDYSGNDVQKTSAIRFISSIDSLYYRGIGFLVAPVGETADEPYMVNTVYERIYSTMSVNGTKKTYEFSPKVVGTESEYFVTAKKEVAANDTTNYRVQACFETLDGTIVYGDARVVGLQDGNENVLNLTVDQAITGTGNNAAVTTYTNSTGTAFATDVAYEVLSTEDNFANVRVNLGSLKVDDMTSASKITIGEAKGVYRNYNTTHVKKAGDATQINADVSWYYINPSATEFVIATSADLYGFANVVNASADAFASNTITLVKNVELNKGEIKKVGESTTPTWVAKEDEVTYEWTPIANSDAKAFNGTFDGDDNEIRGLYLNYKVTAGGLFGYVGKASEIENFKLVDSYMKTTNTQLGIVGQGYLKRCENVYTNAIMIGKQNVGGIIGRLNGHCSGFADATSDECTTKQTFKNCWFDGQIHLEAGASACGGVIGQTMGNMYVNFIECLVTGRIEGTDGENIGGLVAYDNSNSTFKVENSLVSGNINLTGTKVGGFVGGIACKFTKVPVTNSYTTSSTAYGTSASDNVKWNKTIYTKTEESLINTDVATLFPNSTAWINNAATLTTDRGTPILKRLGSWLKEQYVIIPDTSWYRETQNGATYTLTTAEELYGLAQLAKTYTFEKDVIELGADIDLNKADSERVQAWKAGEDLRVNKWTPIGTSEANAFNGKFNGNKKEIRGLYLNYKDTAGGLFGYVGRNCEIENFKLVDSYMTTTNTQLGIVGQGYLKRCENVYTNAVMVGKENVGGIVGRLYGLYTNASDAINVNTTNKQIIKNCWFDGEIILNANANAIGGMVGQAMGYAYIRVVDCLNTGSITGTSNSNVGGFIGYNNSTSTFSIENSLVVGDINLTGTTVGAFFGQIQYKLSKAPITNSYTTLSEAYGTSTSDQVKWDKATYTKTREYLASTDITTLFPDSTAWQQDSADNGTDGGTPILTYFAGWWIGRQ